ncbi:hypothetical protein SCP_0905380 [Sparassis crispa]|uniref:Uncharacterized protein n=1 Tax=Sparassis crispa TaxID=139825 RepID=A0A401GWQ3_9APHY|nr:hypothetical protein SCP_0905380 [Sparassis crispa]GBE86658.1 hypothetical protein SCP_0905380 [Sparassis crispa]
MDEASEERPHARSHRAPSVTLLSLLPPLPATTRVSRATTRCAECLAWQNTSPYPTRPSLSPSPSPSPLPSPSPCSACILQAFSEHPSRAWHGAHRRRSAQRMRNTLPALPLAHASSSKPGSSHPIVVHCTTPRPRNGAGGPGERALTTATERISGQEKRRAEKARRQIQWASKLCWTFCSVLPRDAAPPFALPFTVLVWAMPTRRGGTVPRPVGERFSRVRRANSLSY